MPDTKNVNALIALNGAKLKPASQTLRRADRFGSPPLFPFVKSARCVKYLLLGSSIYAEKGEIRLLLYPKMKNKKTLKKLSQLKLGESGIIDSFTDKDMSLKLLEMGCTPGELVTLDRIAPMGDPIAINVAGYLLSLRKEEASTVLVSVRSN